MSAPVSQVERAVAAYRAQLFALSDGAISLMDIVFQIAYARILQRIDALIVTITVTGTTTVSDVFELAQTSELLREIEREMGTLGRQIERVITDAQAQAVEAAIGNGLALAQAQAGSIDDALELARAWSKIDPATVANIVGVLSDGSPLRTILDTFAPGTRTAVEQALVDAVTQNVNTGVMAQRLAETTNLTRARAAAVTRTSVLDAARQASIEGYRENLDVLKEEWEWNAAFQTRTCLSCIANSGKRFPMTTNFFPAHVNCRCCALPVLRNEEGLERLQTGADWFRKLPESERLKMIPASARDDYRAGKLTLDDFNERREDPKWGPSYGQASVKTARANAAKRTG